MLVCSPCKSNKQRQDLRCMPSDTALIPHQSAEDIHAKAVKGISTKGHESDKNSDAFDLPSERPNQNAI